jgi:acetyltransferase-like isoleucine patch superfamily enzyme
MTEERQSGADIWVSPNHGFPPVSSDVSSPLTSAFSERMTETRLFYELIPGAILAGDWYPGRIPENIECGENSVVDSSFCFKHFFSQLPVGAKIGSNVTIWRASLAPEINALVEIGNYCYIANASLACSLRITIGSYVHIAGGVTITDSDFHPIAPVARLADTIALSPLGDRRKRPVIEVRPVVIEDDVWIGCNATILKGVRVGRGAVIAPGAVVIKDVPENGYAFGNPACICLREDLNA